MQAALSINNTPLVDSNIPLPKELIAGLKGKFASSYEKTLNGSTIAAVGLQCFERSDGIAIQYGTYIADKNISFKDVSAENQKKLFQALVLLGINQLGLLKPDFVKSEFERLGFNGNAELKPGFYGFCGELQEYDIPASAFDEQAWLKKCRDRSAETLFDLLPFYREADILPSSHLTMRRQWRNHTEGILLCSLFSTGNTGEMLVQWPPQTESRVLCTETTDLKVFIKDEGLVEKITNSKRNLDRIIGGILLGDPSHTTPFKIRQYDGGKQFAPYLAVDYYVDLNQNIDLRTARTIATQCEYTRKCSQQYSLLGSFIWGYFAPALESTSTRPFNNRDSEMYGLAPSFEDPTGVHLVWKVAYARDAEYLRREMSSKGLDCSLRTFPNDCLNYLIIKNVDQPPFRAFIEKIFNEIQTSKYFSYLEES